MFRIGLLIEDMSKFFRIKIAECTYYSSKVTFERDIVCVHDYLMTRFSPLKNDGGVMFTLKVIDSIETLPKEEFVAAINTFNFELDDNDNIVPKTETYVSFKSLDQIACELRDSEYYLISSLYDRLFGIKLSRYEELRKEFGERKKSECMFTESETALTFNGYHVLANLLNFEERSN
jgi:hypothetical protein